jgi:AcrR family transcriptional regulator
MTRVSMPANEVSRIDIDRPGRKAALVMQHTPPPSPPPPRARSRERQREDTRQRIYDAAMEIFRRDGFETARVDDVAKAAGVSHGTFYFHFATKDEVLIQCLRASEVRVAAAVETVPEGAGLMAAMDMAVAMIATEWEADPRLFSDVAMVALRYLFKGEVAQLAGAGAAPQVAPSASPKSIVAAAMVGRFAHAAERGEVTRLLPPQVLSDLFLVNVFAATLAWCADPTARPLGMMLGGVIRLFLDGVRGPQV